MKSGSDRHNTEYGPVKDIFRRFNGDIGYMVAFVVVDPLFVMDLSDPYNPKVDGELKIPDTRPCTLFDTLILGFGMDTTEQDGRALNQRY